MRIDTPRTVGLFLSAFLSASALADGTWQVLTVSDGVSPANITGITGAVWVPNQFNNPVIDEDGIVTFRSQIAGPGITNTGATANHVVVVRGTGAPWTVVARSNSGVPGNTPTDAVFSRTASPNNSIVSANNLSADGGFIASGWFTGPGITTGTNDTAQWFIPASGSPSLLAQGRDFCPGTAGAQYPANMTAASGQRVNSVGQCLFAMTLTGGDTVTANNSAIVLLSPGPDQLIVRKGDVAPGLGGPTITPDTFGLFLNGNKYVFSGTLVGTGVTTSNDKIYCTNAFATSGYRIFAREGDAIPGTKGLTVASASTLSFGQCPIAPDGTITFNATLGGTATTINNAAVMTERNGVFTILLRKGDAIPGITDSSDPNFNGKVFQAPNSTGQTVSRNGLYAFQGILMNADGTSIVSPAPATFVGARKPDGTLITICKQTDTIAGLPGWTMGNLNGSTSICVNDGGIVVFLASISKDDGSESGSALMAWDEVGGLRMLARQSSQNASPFAPTGDTFFTGTPINQLTLIGSTGNNGDGTGTGFSGGGWLTLRAGDSANALYAIARIRLGSTTNPCPADIDSSGAVDASDLAGLLGGWGGSSPDLNGDGIVNASDLSVLLSAWGPCQ
ncbi:MAG: choice-of-anchor tandem repeat NxxGxxAF-containing protein [Planctomycetota bacterium]